jgi:hypothetical protein
LLEEEAKGDPGPKSMEREAETELRVPRTFSCMRALLFEEALIIDNEKNVTI